MSPVVVHGVKIATTLSNKRSIGGRTKNSNASPAGLPRPQAQRLFWSGSFCGAFPGALKCTGLKQPIDGQLKERGPHCDGSIDLAFPQAKTMPPPAIRATATTMPKIFGRFGLTGFCGIVGCSMTSRRSECWPFSRFSPSLAAESFCVALFSSSMTLVFCVSRVSSPGLRPGCRRHSARGSSAARGFLERGDLSLKRLNIGMACRIRRTLDQQLGFKRCQLPCAVEVPMHRSHRQDAIFLIAIIWASTDDSLPSSLLLPGPRNRVVCAANSVRERTSSERSMVTNSFATLLAMSGRSYSKPMVKAIASLFLVSSFCSDGLMTVRLRMKSTISVPETRSNQPDVR